MEKLLHERLRDWKSDECIAPLYVIALKDACSAAANDAFTAFADEIERYYIPRPRFEDGEPVQFGDATDELYHVDTISFYEDGGISLNSVDSDVFLGVGELVKRPTPKVYDADRVECKRGDEVWDLKGFYDDPLTVLDPNDCGSVKVTIPDGKGYTNFTADQLTHERPVFDADGERIKAGENRYSIKYGHEVIVNQVRADYCICSQLGDGCTLGSSGYEPSDLTNREPDSLEKLMEDATKPQRQYYNDFIGHDVGLKDDEEINIAVHTHIINRAIAIKRGA